MTIPRPTARTSSCRALSMRSWFDALLVLLLAFDLLGAPLHLHRHDGGWSSSELGALGAAPSIAAADAAHLEAPAARHSVAALRSVAGEQSQADGVDRLAPVRPRTLALPPVEVDGLGLDAAGPSVLARVHRSLPPDGRAPPLHA